MPSYLLLVMEPRGQRQARTAEQGRELQARMRRYGEGLKARGLLKSCDSLRSDEHGVRIRVRDGKRTLTDGPFTEAKEMIGGYFLFDCASREEALALAAACPAVEWASVELREIGPCYE
ncbi:MAG: YciI family protein [Sinobacteraceae bacterium]|nr:dehydrogenase [Nevskia sp.]MDI3260018.1 YciI family protein [Nevskiaceae bacterium]